MKNLKKLMIFTLVALNAAPVSAAKADKNLLAKHHIGNPADRIRVWAYCQETSFSADKDSCNKALDSLILEPGLFGSKKSPEDAARTIDLLAYRGNSSLVAGVDVDYDGKSTRGNNITGRETCSDGTPRIVSPERAALVDRTKAQVVIETGIHISENEKSLQSPYNGYFLDVLMGGGIRKMTRQDFKGITSHFVVLLGVEAATNPTVSFPRYEKPTFVDYISGAATL